MSRQQEHIPKRDSFHCGQPNFIIEKEGSEA